MNRPAYFTTSFAIRTLANLSKADVVIHGEDNIPSGPTIFVVNHFTRIETLLIPYYIYKLTDIPALSLASDSLFKGGLKKYFELVGVISTKDPNRDRIIIRGLLTGSENWIIFPEGRMVKTKKIMGDGAFLISHSNGQHKPHTGAASLALRAEFFRNHLLAREDHEPDKVADFLKTFEIDSLDAIRNKKTSIVPVNLTYYPIRAKENIATYFATRMLKEVPERMLEELMTEGTMLLSGVDLDIHFGKPITLEDFLSANIVKKELQQPMGDAPVFSDTFSTFMREKATLMMEMYMKSIYDMTTINHEHLFALFLKLYPYSKMSEMGLRRKVYLAAQEIYNANSFGCNLHKSLKENQIHLITDDRFKKVENFLKLAFDIGVLEKRDGFLYKVRSKISDLLPFDRGRIDNPIKVVANEAEPLVDLQRIVRAVAWQPDFWVKMRVVKGLFKEEKQNYSQDCRECAETELQSKGPRLFRGSTRKIGVVLIHSYLSVPEEVKDLARYLKKCGLWVYTPRLAGHGTTVDDLATKKFSDWQYSVEKGYAIMSNICDKVVLGGVSIGGCLALDLASRLPKLAGVFAVCPPIRLKDYSTTFMPGLDVWNRIVSKIKRDNLERDFFQFTSENPYVNYDKNPIMGVKEIGNFLAKLKTSLANVVHPSLIIHADKDPVVDSDGSKIIYDELGAESKEYVLMNYDNHIIVNGKGSDKVHKLIANFVRDVRN